MTSHGTGISGHAVFFFIYGIYPGVLNVTFCKTRQWYDKTLFKKHEFFIRKL